MIAKKENINGADAFKLYDTFGFPLELTQEIAQENGLSVDVEGFNAEMKQQKERAKAATQKISLTDDLVYVDIENKFGSTDFVGYEKEESESKIVASVNAGDFVDIILDKTPFYAECGGQVGDSGVIENAGFKAEVLTTFKVNKLFVHRCNIINGEVTIGETVTAKIDSARRKQIRIHHTSAHLLQAALVKVLGDEVKQAGSQVEEKRTRFDFSFSRAMTLDEIDKVEQLINEWIGRAIDVDTKVMDINEAKKTGATALFGEKYEDKVRVVSIGDVSKEFCAGTHVGNIGEIRVLKIVSESAIAAGTRRIESVSADSAIELLRDKSKTVDELSKKLKTPANELIERIEKIEKDNLDLNKELEELKAQNIRNKFSTFISRAKDIDGGKLFISRIEDVPAPLVKIGIDLLSNKLGESILILASVKKDNSALSIFVKVGDSFVKKGVNAGKIVGEIAAATGGKGGGRPNFAQGGGKDPSKLDEIFEKLEKDFQ